MRRLLDDLAADYETVAEVLARIEQTQRVIAKRQPLVFPAVVGSSSPHETSSGNPRPARGAYSRAFIALEEQMIGTPARSPAEIADKIRLVLEIHKQCHELGERDFRLLQSAVEDAMYLDPKRLRAVS